MRLRKKEDRESQLRPLSRLHRYKKRTWLCQIFVSEYLGELERLLAIKNPARAPNCAEEMQYLTQVYIAAGLRRSVLFLAFF